jgi:glycerol-3-phosphate acyltransferase PlsY
MFIKFFYIFTSYFCGSVPFAYIYSKIINNVDIRTVGSGNSGTTNVFRCVGKKAGIITFVCDVLKGFVPVYFSIIFYDSFYFSAIVSIVVILGHVFTIFLNFNGGKGVATAIGVFLAIIPSFLVLFFGFFVFFLIFFITRYISLSSVCLFFSIPIVLYFFKYEMKYEVFSFIVFILIAFKHKVNFVRIKNGTEQKFIIYKKTL